MVIETIAKSQQQTRDSIGSIDDTKGNLAFFVNKEKVKTRVVREVVKITTTNANAFLIGISPNAKLGIGLLGNTGSGAGTSEWLRRQWEYDTYERLKLGTYSANVDITNGDIRLMRQ
ncbi:hypothetical protein HYU06_05865 [Candidatus Woesearchaeota archaeon]|nr:hypothetical protein [Candidatus Woesearchaeota archaeon]